MKETDTKFSPHHEWGDEWFEQYGKELGRITCVTFQD